MGSAFITVSPFPLPAKICSSDVIYRYPIAPIGVQGCAWLAYRLWSKVFKNSAISFAQKLDSQAVYLKKAFNEQFVYQEKNYYFGAQAIDGIGQLIKTVIANPLIYLWVVEQAEGKAECILEDKFIEGLVERVFYLIYLMIRQVSGP